MRRGFPEARSQGTAVVVTHTRRSAVNYPSGPAPRLRSLRSARHLSHPSGFHTSPTSSSPHLHALLDVRAASAPFFSPARHICPFLSPPHLPPPPLRAPRKSRCTHVRFFPACVPRPSPSPPPAPAGVFTLLFIFCLGICPHPLSTPPCVSRRPGCCACLPC